MGIHIKNIMEDIVTKKADALMRQHGCCTCENCRADVVAYALNNTPPKYVGSKEREVASKAALSDQATDTNLTITIMQAIQLVQESPRH